MWLVLSRLFNLLCPTTVQLRTTHKSPVLNSSFTMLMRQCTPGTTGWGHYSPGTTPPGQRTFEWPETLRLPPQPDTWRCVPWSLNIIWLTDRGANMNAGERDYLCCNNCWCFLSSGELTSYAISKVLLHVCITLLEPIAGAIIIQINDALSLFTVYKQAYPLQGFLCITE